MLASYLALVMSVVTPAVAGPIGGPAAKTKYLFVFGDSYSSTGFDINGAKPSTANPLGNPPLPGNTLSGGLTWPGYLATAYNKSLTLTYNFAVAGATVDNAVVQGPYGPSIPSVSDQINTWNQNLAPKPSYAPWTSENALFAVWVGTNDIAAMYNTATFAATLKADLDRLFVLLTGLYAQGARNLAILNIAPTYKTPLMSGMPDVALLASGIAQWNAELKKRTDNLCKSTPGAIVQLVDTAPAFNEPIANPPKYGAIDATCVTCPGAPDQVCGPSDGKCLWYNTYHPGIAIEREVAKRVAKAVGPKFF